MKISNIFNKLINNILIVDDNEDNVSLLEGYLSDIKGIRIYKSYNPLDAEELLKTIDFSLLLLDIQMNDMDGYELATRIKYNNYGKNSNTPIVFITAIYDNDIDKMRGYNIGSIDYIIKPITIDIVKKIRNYLDITNKKNSNKNFVIQRMDNINKSIKM